jgi:signal transduction histidine kinase
MTLTEENVDTTLDAQLRASRARILANSNATRQALERRLHDGPQQHLVAMAVKLRLIENCLDDSPDDAKHMLEELRGDVQATVQQLRDIASAIFPPLLGDRGLAEALRAAAAREGGWAEINVDESACGRYSTEIEAAVYFGVVDAMHHVDGPIGLELHDAGDKLVLTIRGGLPDDAIVHVEDRINTVGGVARRDGRDVIVEVPFS